MYEKFIGNKVVIRSNMSGVHYGTLVAIEGDTAGLTDCRRVWSWRGAGSCSGLAAFGPKEGNIAAPVDIVVKDVCEVILASPEADAAFAAIAVWNG